MLTLTALLGYKLRLTNGYIVQPSKRVSSIIENPQWYFIKHDFSQKLQDLATFYNIQIHSSDVINSEYFYGYLTPSQASQFGSAAIPLTPQAKDYTQGRHNNNYVVYAHDSFSRGGIPISPNLFVVQNTKLKQLLEDSRVRTVYSLPSFTLNNRWSTGFLQSGQDIFITDDEGFTSNRIFNKNGFTGQNTTVTIVDAGIDTTHPFLSDKAQSVMVNQTNFNHRKVVLYQSLFTSITDVARHGTHCAGSVLGVPQDNKSALYRYRGMAPDSKLFLYDARRNLKATGIEMNGLDFIELQNHAEELNSHIISCSWGNKESNTFTRIIDAVSFSSPNLLFVVSSGNERNFFSVNSPGNSKNCLTVGSINAPWASTAESSQNRVSFIEIGGRQVPIENDVFNKPLKSKLTIGDNGTTSIVASREDIEKAKSLGHSVLVSFNGMDDSEVTILRVGSQYKDLFKEGIEFTVNLSSKASRRSITRSDFSSLSTLFGYIKPEVMAPGENIISSALNGQMAAMSGTSMSTPLIAGQVALVECWLKKAKGYTDNMITSHLLRSIIVATTSSLPSIQLGFGVPNISLLLTRNSLFFTQSIATGDTISLTLSIKRGPLVVCLSYLDFPSDLDNEFPLIADLDLVLEGPNGIEYGNSHEESFSTTEIITLEDAEEGEYKLVVFANDFLEANLSFSLSVIGNFDEDQEANFTEETELIRKSCNSSSTGKFCQIPTTLMGIGYSHKKSIQPRELFYFTIDPSNVTKKYILLRIYAEKMEKGYIHAGFYYEGDDSYIWMRRSVGNPRFYLEASTLEKGELLKAKVLVDTAEAKTFSITLTNENEIEEEGGTISLGTLFACLTVFSLLIVAGIYFLWRETSKLKKEKIKQMTEPLNVVQEEDEPEV